MTAAFVRKYIWWQVLMGWAVPLWLVALWPNVPVGLVVASAVLEVVLIVGAYGAADAEVRWNRGPGGWRAFQ